MNILERLRNAWKGHDEKLAEEALVEQPKVNPYATPASQSDEDVREHAEPES